MNKYYTILKFIFSILLVATFLYLIIFSINTKYNTPNNTIIKFMSKNIYQGVSEGNILAELQNTINFQDSLYVDINTSLLEDLLLQHKYIKKAEVYLDLSDVLNVFIDFRQPFVKVLPILVG